MIEDFNEYNALPRSVIFEAVGWEHTLGGVGRPQQIINEGLRSCDYFFMLLWDRWGFLAGGATLKVARWHDFA